MPVRIYEIAKKLGVESKVVLLRAKELGIATAKVPSSSLDKITAEYLEQQMAAIAPPPLPPPSEVLPVQLVAAPQTPAPSAQESGGDSRRAFVSGRTPSSSEFMQNPDGVGREGEKTELESDSESHTTPHISSGIQSEEQVRSLDALDTGGGEPNTGGESLPPVSLPTVVEQRDNESAKNLAPEALGERVPTTEASQSSASESLIPAEPQKPQVGDKVGFINLGGMTRGRPGDSRGRPEERRDSRQPAPGSLQAPSPSSPSPGGTQSAGQRPSPGTAPRPNPGPGNYQGQRPGNFQGQRPGNFQGQQRPGNFPGQQRPGNFQGQQRPGFANQRTWQQPQRGMGGGPGFGSSSSGSSRPPTGPPKSQLSVDAPTIVIRPPIMVRELAEKMGRKPFQVIADLMGLGVFATVTQTVDPEVAVKVCAKHGIRFETEKRDKAAHVVNVPKEQKLELDQEDTPESLVTRPPVITIMGHVDHGKTSLLDVIRKANVAAGEAGGITQHIGAYTISYPHPTRKDEMMRLTFLDTPGHAAFSAMRARGANVTDIVILVVAANDGVMPQTLEALAHAQAAKVPIIVAVNKCDHPAANPIKVRQQLQDKGLVPDDWGGDTLYVDCSALTKLGIDKLIDSILLQAEFLELKGNPNRRSKGNVIESGVHAGGPVATVLVRKGTMRVGDVIICGEHYGKVRAMMNEEGDRLKEATPSMAVRVLGLNGVPEAGSEFSVVENERAARDLAEERLEKRKKSEQDGFRPRRQTLEDIFGQISDMSAKTLCVIVKADMQGSLEAICDALQKVDSDKVSLEIAHSAVGAITESDVLLASSSDAVILGFHTRVDPSAAEAAKREGVQIKLYAIIYELIDQVKEAMAGLLDPLLKEVVVGQAEVRKLFPMSKGGVVAGCAVTSGRILRGKMRVRRKTNVIFEGVSLTLKRFQDDVNEVRSGMECGIRLDGFDDFIEGDFIECYTVEKIVQKML